jgi:cell division protein FtsW
MPRRLEIDRWLFVVTLALCLLGAVMIYSASAVTAEHDFGRSYYFLLRQSVWLVIGVAGMFALMRMDYRKLREPLAHFSSINPTPRTGGFALAPSVFSLRRSPSSL